jgi:ABC-type bacteriocin/lantibiotic exporter with double-glycine peptidase domain
MDSQKNNLLKLSALLVAVFAIGGVSNFAKTYLFKLSGERIVISLRSRLFEGLMKSRAEFFDSTRTGELVSVK